MNLDKLSKLDWNPTSRQVGKNTLLYLLKKGKKNIWFCKHRWIYWTFGKATKKHRVCEKCYKKQQHTAAIPKHKGRWIKEKNFI